MFNRGTKDNPNWYVGYREHGKWVDKPTKAQAKRFVQEIEGRISRGQVGIEDTSDAPAFKAQFETSLMGSARFTIPTVPTDLTYIAPFVMPDGTALHPDDKVRGRIKWYVTPLVFGGDPNLGDNVTWVTLDQQTKLVVWWNQKYRELRPRK